MSILDFVLLRYIKNERTDSNLYYGDSNCNISDLQKKKKQIQNLKIKIN